MTNDEIIRSFLDLHSDTPINGQEYAIQLRMIRIMLNVAVKLEREACAKLMDDMAAKDNLSNYYKVAANKIRAREQQ
jgi:hypothetical protein